MHFLGADLNLKRLPGMNYRGVQRLVKIRQRHGDVILKAPGHGAPDVVDNAERGVTVAVGIGDHADGEQIVNLIEAARLADNFAMQRIEALDAGFQLRGNAVFDELGADGVLDVFEKSLVKGSFVAELLLQREVRVRFQVAEGKIFEFALDDGHTEAVSDRRVNVHRLAGDANLFGRLQELQRSHVVEAVGKLYHHNPNVLHHGQQHLANVFRLARFRRHHVQAADFGDTFDKLGYLAAKAFLETRKGKLGVFNDVVEQGRRERGGVHADIDQNVGHFQEMRDVGIARSAKLVVVALRGDFERAPHRPAGF